MVINKKFYLSVIWSLFYSNFIFAQQSFLTAELDSASGLNSFNVGPTGDYIVFSSHNIDASILKIDNAGNILQQYKVYNFRVRSGIQTPDLGYLLGGDSNNIACIIRLDSNGNRLWKTEINSHMTGNVSAVGMSFTGGYYACVNNDSVSFPIPKKPNYLVLFDSLGNINLKIKLNDLGYVYSGESVLSLSDSTWIILSIVSNLEFTKIHKLDATGNLLWTKTYVDTTLNSYPYSSFGISKLAADTFLITGYCMDTNGTEMGLVYAIDSNGDSVWSKNYAPFNNYSGFRLIKGYGISNGDYYLSGTLVDNLNSSSTILLMRINSAGDTIWTKQFPGRGRSGMNSMLIDLNGYPMIVGFNYDTTASYTIFSYFIYCNPLTPVISTKAENKKISVILVSENYILKCPDRALVYIYDVSGKLISKQQLYNGSVIKTSDLLQGIYIFYITDSKGIKHYQKVSVRR